MWISQSTMDYITANTVRCFLLHRGFFFAYFFFQHSLLQRIYVQIKHCYDFSVSWRLASTPPWVIAAAEAFYVSQFSSQWKSTCFYKSSPLRNTCTEQQAHCFPLSYIVKIERPERQHQAGLLNHSSFLAPLGWLRVPVRNTPSWLLSDSRSCNLLVILYWAVLPHRKHTLVFGNHRNMTSLWLMIAKITIFSLLTRLCDKIQMIYLLIDRSWVHMIWMENNMIQSISVHLW